MTTASLGRSESKNLGYSKNWGSWAIFCLYVQGHQNGLLRTDRSPAKLPIHLDSIAKCLDIVAKDYYHLRHSNDMQTNPLPSTSTIDHSWPKAVGLLWACEGAKADDLKADYWNSLRNFGDAFS